jgi:hypothetical protein
LACGDTERETGTGAAQGAGAAGGGPADCSDFGADPCVATVMASLIEAGTTFATASSALVADVTLACESIASALGVGSDYVTTTDPAERVQQWCEVAANRIKTELTLVGALSVSFASPYCVLAIEELGSCEQACNAGNPACELTEDAMLARCSPEALSGSCAGECPVSCTAAPSQSVPCDGSCQGACTGSCDGATWHPRLHSAQAVRAA